MCEDSRRDQKGLIQTRKWRWVLKISRYREEKKENRESVRRKRREDEEEEEQQQKQLRNEGFAEK